MDYKELCLYGRNIRFYDENHIEMEYYNIKDNWRQVTLTKANTKGHNYKEIIVTNKGKQHSVKLHRLVFWVHNPLWEILNSSRNNAIDHINNDCLDNRIENLRCVTQQENNWNMSGKGYYWNKLEYKWKAQIGLNNKTIYLGSFDKEENARDAYLVAKEKYHIIKERTFD
jgi:hypothetical protein